MQNKIKTPFIGKKAFKRRAGKCQICKEDDYTVLDTHRIIEQGIYSNENCVCLCVKCHRLVSMGKIKTLNWVNSTGGKLLHYIDKNGEEQFI